MIRLLLLLLVLALPVNAQTLRLAISDPVIGLDPNYAGQPIALFGTIEDCACDAVDYDVAVSIMGPPRARVVNRSGRSGSGLIATLDRTFYDRLPSVYFLLTNAPLDRILRDDPDAARLLTPLGQIASTRTGEVGGAGEFDAALLAELEEREEFGTDSSAVHFVGPRFFTARVRLPSSALAGPYIAHVKLIHQGEIVAVASQAFVIRTIGFEARLIELIRQSPAYYGLLCVCVALVTGWIGGIVFRR